jgi:hypothetical protein
MTTQTNDFYAINDLLVVSIVANTKRLYQIVDIKNDKLICKQISGKMTTQNEYCQSELIPNINNFIDSKPTTFKVVLELNPKKYWLKVGDINFSKYYVYKYNKPLILDFYN